MSQMTFSIYDGRIMKIHEVMLNKNGDPYLILNVASNMYDRNGNQTTTDVISLTIQGEGMIDYIKRVARVGDTVDVMNAPMRYIQTKENDVYRNTLYINVYMSPHIRIIPKDTNEVMKNRYDGKQFNNTLNENLEQQFQGSHQ